MPSHRLMASALGVAFAVGGIFGQALADDSPPPPKVKTVVKTKVVTREVNRPTPIPDSCREAIAKLPGFMRAAGKVSKQTGQAADDLTDAGTAIALRDITQLNQVIEQLHLTKSDLDTSTIDLNEANEILGIYYETCLKKMRS